MAVSYGNVDENSPAYQVQITMIIAALMCMSGRMRDGVAEAYASFVFSHPLGAAFSRWSAGNGLDTLPHLSDLRRLQFESLRTGQFAFDPSLSFSVYSEIDPRVLLIARIQELYPDRLRGAIFDWVWLVITRFPVATICRYLAQGPFIYTWVGLQLILRGEAMLLAVSMLRGGMFRQMRSLVQSAAAAGISGVIPFLNLVSDLLTQLLTIVTMDTRGQSPIADGYITAFGYAIQDRIRTYVFREAVRWAMREAQSLHVRTNAGLANFFAYLLAIRHPLISDLRAIISSDDSDEGDETISLEDYCVLFGRSDLSHAREALSTSQPSPSNTTPQSAFESPREEQTVDSPQQVPLSAPSYPSAPPVGPSTVHPPPACLQLYFNGSESMEVEPDYDPLVVSDKEMALARDFEQDYDSDPAVVSDKEMALARSFEGVEPIQLSSAAALPLGPAAQGLDRGEDEGMDSSNSSDTDLYQESEASEFRGLIQAYAPDARHAESDSYSSNDDRDDGLIRVDHEAPYEDVSGDHNRDDLHSTPSDGSQDDDDEDMHLDQFFGNSDGGDSSSQPLSPESRNHYRDHLLDGPNYIAPSELQSQFGSLPDFETISTPTLGSYDSRASSGNQDFGRRASFDVEAQQDTETRPRTMVLSADGVHMGLGTRRGRPPTERFNTTFDDEQVTEPTGGGQHQSDSAPRSNTNSPPRTRSRTRLVASTRAGTFARGSSSTQATTSASATNTGQIAVASDSNTAMQTDQNGHRSSTTLG